MVPLSIRLAHGNWYEERGDKANLARRYLSEHLDMSPADAAALTRGSVMQELIDRAGVDAWGARELLWDTYDPTGMWLPLMLMGVGSIVLMIIYERVTTHARKNPSFSFNTHGRRWVQAAVVPIFIALVIAWGLQFSFALDEPHATIGDALLISMGLLLNAVPVGLLVVGSFVLPEEVPGEVTEAPPDLGRSRPQR